MTDAPLPRPVGGGLRGNTLGLRLALAFLGVCPPGQRPKHAHSCHSNRMTIDESGMQTGIAMNVAVALSYLAQHESGKVGAAVD